MQIKKIKSINIGCYKMNIVWDNNAYDGSFDFSINKIRIGTKSGKDLEILGIITHEIQEAYMAVNSMRHQINNGEYLFNFNHAQFNTMINETTYLLSQFIN